MTTSSLVAKTIVYKPPFAPKNGWLPYGTVIIMLLILVLVIAKKYKPSATRQSVCQLVEKKQLSNKTVVYIIDYQQQRFLLADNQHALALHPLTQETSNEPA